MISKEKVIKGLECCRDLDISDMKCPDACPYHDCSNEFGCCNYIPLMDDAIALLKEEPEPVKPTKNQSLLANFLGWNCGACGFPLLSDGYVYCPRCGKKVDWNGL